MNPPDNTANTERQSKFQLGDHVERKLSGRGVIDQVRAMTSGNVYHVRFEDADVEMWCPEEQLAAAKPETATEAAA